MRRWIVQWAAIGLCVLGSARAYAETLSGMITDKPSETTGGLDYPTQYSLRPLTLTKGLVSFELAYQHAQLPEVQPRYLGSYYSQSGDVVGRTNEFVRATVELGITDNFTLEITPFAYGFGDDFDFSYWELATFNTTPFERTFGDEIRPSGFGLAKLGATYRILDSDSTDLGLRARVGASDSEEAGAIHIAAGIPLRIRGEVVSVTTGLDLSLLNLLYYRGPVVGLMSLPANFAVPEPGLPLSVDVSFSPNIFAGIRTGMGMSNLSDPARSLFLPLGAQAGASFDPGGAVLLDLVGGFTFPYFYFDEYINPEVYAVDVSAKVHFQVF
jgi:hypothetical protein